MLLVPEKLESYRRQMSVALEANRPKDAAHVSIELSPHRVASLLMEAPPEMVLPCLMEMSTKRSGQVIGAMKPDYAAEIVKNMEGENAAKFFPFVPVHQAADILQRLSEKDAMTPPSMRPKPCATAV
ncbi:MAG: hypothetical protein JJU29_05510 [Verrucomicrobia bacterium]|nr:hypothetical protein [Verrucomicrobiota bacterium]MCH8512696.1 hypothetical protein [Kiritimatiellia bacterium]